MAKQKASLETLNALHSQVADQLATNLDDPKVLSMAVKFLKDNDITADIIGSESMLSLTASIQKIADAAQEGTMSVDDMLNVASKAH